MVNVSLKPETLRSAKASCFVQMSLQTLKALKENNLPKGEALVLAQVAGIQAAKQTPHLIPLCHGLNAKEITVDLSYADRGVRIVSRVEVVAATGPEMEALVAASVAALALYDMCKAIDKSMVIGDLKLIEKSGGKSGSCLVDLTGNQAVVLTLSDRAFQGIYSDLSGPEARAALSETGIKIVQQEVVPDDLETIVDRLVYFCEVIKPDLILTLGGTGMSPRDVAPEAALRVIERKAPGITEMLRQQSFAKHPTSSFLSRAVAGIRGKTLIVNLPGKPSAVVENLNLLIPAFAHIFRMIAGEGHEKPC